MKRFIIALCILTSLVSFPMNSARYHTWFLLRRCMNHSNFETQARKDFLTLLGSQVNIKDKDTVILTNEDLIHQGSLVTGLTTLVSSKGAIYCTTLPSNSMALVDIFTDEMDFNKREVGEICRRHFDAKSHDLAYTLPHELTEVMKTPK